MPKGPQGQTGKPTRKRLNASQKTALMAAKVRLFMEKYGRGVAPGYDPNDRVYDRELEEKIKRMRPEELDRHMREDE